jgi:hypothetical protein
VISLFEWVSVLVYHTTQAAKFSGIYYKATYARWAKDCLHKIIKKSYQIKSPYIKTMKQVSVDTSLYNK